MILHICRSLVLASCGLWLGAWTPLVMASVNPTSQEIAEQEVSSSADESVAFEIEVLTAEEAALFMQEQNLTEESLQAIEPELAFAPSALEVQAADGPFGFFGQIFGGNSQPQQRGIERGRRGRHRREREPAANSGGYESGGGLFGGWGGASSGTCAARSGMASYYGSELAGHRTASGARFNPGGFTAAHRTLRFGTRVRVTHGGRSVVVTINDRGPFVAGRVIDLSAAAARSLGLTTGYVSLQVLGCG